jgi:hypothetical protein
LRFEIIFQIADSKISEFQKVRVVYAATCRSSPLIISRNSCFERIDVPIADIGRSYAASTEIPVLSKQGVEIHIS